MVTLEKSYPVIWLAALLLSWSVVCNAEFTASVDRTIVNQHDTVELTLRSDKQQFGAEPDLSPLHELFTVLGRSQRSQFQSVNGKTQSWTDWIITLRPKRSGYVVIPPISLKGEKTKPITLDVKNAGSQTTGKNVSPVFIEASLDKETVYVQEQTVLTIYIYHSVALYDDSRITPLNIPNAISQQLGNVKNYETILNGPSKVLPLWIRVETGFLGVLNSAIEQNRCQDSSWNQPKRSDQHHNPSKGQKHLNSDMQVVCQDHQRPGTSVPHCVAKNR